ncbi:MAG: hypothetical protein KGH66_04065 [Candidatus Micrarchaeota archaeon]|nr:hypothetical protein [Candidatus Micrarchaeota archaeon]
MKKNYKISYVKTTQTPQFVVVAEVEMGESGTPEEAVEKIRADKSHRYHRLFADEEISIIRVEELE